ncbi:MAG: hypothetical protein ACXVBW_09315 [Bdellovibrionota bacterium]
MRVFLALTLIFCSATALAEGEVSQFEFRLQPWADDGQARDFRIHPTRLSDRRGKAVVCVVRPEDPSHFVCDESPRAARLASLDKNAEKIEISGEGALQVALPVFGVDPDLVSEISPKLSAFKNPAYSFQLKTGEGYQVVFDVPQAKPLRQDSVTCHGQVRPGPHGSLADLKCEDAGPQAKKKSSFQAYGVRVLLGGSDGTRDLFFLQGERPEEKEAFRTLLSGLSRLRQRHYYVGEGEGLRMVIDKSLLRGKHEVRIYSGSEKSYFADRMVDDANLVSLRERVAPPAK